MARRIKHCMREKRVLISPHVLYILFCNHTMGTNLVSTGSEMLVDACRGSQSPRKKSWDIKLNADDYNYALAA